MLITQRLCLKTSEIFTWYQGDRTNSFDADTKDKEKLFVIEEVSKFLHTLKSHALVAQWSEQSAHN